MLVYTEHNTHVRNVSHDRRILLELDFALARVNESGATLKATGKPEPVRLAAVKVTVSRGNEDT